MCTQPADDDIQQENASLLKILLLNLNFDGVLCKGILRRQWSFRKFKIFMVMTLQAKISGTKKAPGFLCRIFFWAILKCKIKRPLIFSDCSALQYRIIVPFLGMRTCSVFSVCFFGCHSELINIIIPVFLLICLIFLYISLSLLDPFALCSLFGSLRCWVREA